MGMLWLMHLNRSMTLRPTKSAHFNECVYERCTPYLTRLFVLPSVTI